jgi:hypothetical protein
MPILEALAAAVGVGVVAALEKSKKNVQDEAQAENAGVSQALHDRPQVKAAPGSGPDLPRHGFRKAGIRQQLQEYVDGDRNLTDAQVEIKVEELAGRNPSF